MPIYEYRRPDGSTFEVLQSFTDEPLERDPQTGDPVERVLHAPAVHFKGKGFYNTDYGTRKRQRETSTASGEGASARSSENGSSPATSEKASENASEKASSNGSDGKAEKKTAPPGGKAKGEKLAASTG
jgi:putative FmdB family regulatory protein